MMNFHARQYLAINNLLSVINSSSTFILYAFFDEKFRQVGQYFLYCQPLPASFDMRTGTTRVLKSSYILGNRRSINPNRRYSPKTKYNQSDLTKETLISSNHVPIFI
jgi:hypothetical protein